MALLERWQLAQLMERPTLVRRLYAFAAERGVARATIHGDLAESADTGEAPPRLVKLLGDFFDSPRVLMHPECEIDGVVIGAPEHLAALIGDELREWPAHQRARVVRVMLNPTSISGTVYVSVPEIEPDGPADEAGAPKPLGGQAEAQFAALTAEFPDEMEIDDPQTPDFRFIALHYRPVSRYWRRHHHVASYNEDDYQAVLNAAAVLGAATQTPLPSFPIEDAETVFQCAFRQMRAGRLPDPSEMAILITAEPISVAHGVVSLNLDEATAASFASFAQKHAGRFPQLLAAVDEIRAWAERREAFDKFADWPLVLACHSLVDFVENDAKNGMLSSLLFERVEAITANLANYISGQIAEVTPRPSRNWVAIGRLLERLNRKGDFND